MDVLYMTGNDHALEKADPLELAEIKRRWEPYINQLPDYAYPVSYTHLEKVELCSLLTEILLDNYSIFSVNGIEPQKIGRAHV